MEIRIGEYKVVISLNARYSNTHSAVVIGYAFRNVISRFDEKSVTGTDRIVPGDECIGVNGPYPTKELAYAAGQAAAELYIFQLPKR